jgi:ATP-binding cassette subfamily F protein 3
VVKTVARALAPISGEMTEGKGLNIGYFAQQELDVLRPADTPLEHMIRLVKEVTADGKISGQATREQDLRSFLGMFNFGGDMVKQAVGSMSGGEKARLVLCMIVWQRPNLLLLDEPTNHLDLATREALSMALNEFEGTVMLVSHDRALLRAVCDEFWMVSRGGVAPFDGDLDDYQRYLLDEAKRQRESARESAREETAARKAPLADAPAEIDNITAASSTGLSAQEQRKQDAARRQQLTERTRPIKRALEQAEARMATLTQDKARLEQRLCTPLPAPEIADTGRQLKTVIDELDALEGEWLSLSEQMEQTAAA